MRRSVAQRQTLASFDYQWAQLPDGDAMLSDPWFLDNVERIVAQELVGVEPGWFAGRSVLDAGCGGGRWTVGLLRLGCRVLAVDASRAAVEQTRAQAERLAPEAVAAGRLAAEPVDLLDIPAHLQGRRFDLVFSFGVLHHTGNTRRALSNLLPLLRPDGLLYLYLYGSQSVSLVSSLILRSIRVCLAPLPFPVKTRVLARLFPRRDTHQAFDLFSPLINETLDYEMVAGWLRAAGLTEVQRTMDFTDLSVRASSSSCSAIPFLQPPEPPYWFERYRRRG